MQNGYVERFNWLFGKAILDAYLFLDLDEVRQLTQEWMEEYNERRPHEGFKNHTPEDWKNMIQKNEYLQLSTV
jgi:putative transposase